jgi:hypothetical protein
LRLSHDQFVDPTATEIVFRQNIGHRGGRRIRRIFLPANMSLPIAAIKPERRPRPSAC